MLACFLTFGSDATMFSMGDCGTLMDILFRSSRLKPRGRLPMTLSATKLLCRLAEPSDCHLALSSCGGQHQSADGI